jgi:hypothetical protein
MNELLEVIPYFINAVFLICSLCMVLSWTFIGLTKADLNHAFVQFNSQKKIKFQNNNFRLLNPFIYFDVFLRIPDYNDNPEFYDINIVNVKYAELKSYKRLVLFGFLGVLASLVALMLYSNLIR